MSSLVWLSLLIFSPLIGAVVVAMLPANQVTAIRWTTLASVLVALLLAVGLMLSPAGSQAHFAWHTAEIQSVAQASWIPSFEIEYLLGLDGLNYPLLILTAALTALALVASGSITKAVKSYCLLVLVLASGMLGVFLALDLILFYVFFEAVLFPMYFLIGLWGGDRKEYAAIKFFLYTLLGSVLILVGLLILYFGSDLTRLSDEQLAGAHVAPSVIEQVQHARSAERGVPTFNMLALRELALTTDTLESPLLWGKSTAWWAFVMLAVGLLIKVPIVPLHTWLPDAHVEAPTPISMLLAGVLLKLGGYGLIRIAIPICPGAAYELAWLLAILGTVSILYGALAALAQTDFKRLVAYSSVSHMGFVVLGLSVWSANPDNGFDPRYQALGLNGAMYQMIAHGVISAGLFFIVGMLYERVGHRQLGRFGNICETMPRFSVLSFVLIFAAIGLPGLCGFVGELFVMLAAWSFQPVLAVLAALSLVLTAGYFLGVIQRVYLGPTYTGPRPEALTDATPRELWVLVPLALAAIVLGIFPAIVLVSMEPSVSLLAEQLAEWTATGGTP